MKKIKIGNFKKNYKEPMNVGDLRRYYKMIGSSNEIIVKNNLDRIIGIILLYIDDIPKNHYIYNTKKGIEYHIITVCVNDNVDDFKFDLSDKHFENHILLFTSVDSEQEIISTIDDKITEIKYKIII